MARLLLHPCPKTYTQDLDKACAPGETVRQVRERLAGCGLNILAETRRIDTGRLGIPVYMSVCGKDAAGIVPTRKQMGKGSSPAQAEASAIMELMERYAFFTFWRDQPDFERLYWHEAEDRFGDALIPVQEILLSVQDTLPAEKARKILELVPWSFYPATRLPDGKTVWLPLDWFRMLGEFNGSAAGNSNEESLLQALSELIERHVCARIAKECPTLPTIDPDSAADPALVKLIQAFRNNGIQLVLKDFSMQMPIPTVGAIAWDPATFPASSEIVYTAGTATTPEKAAIRAVTEIAQLGGDFCTSSCYEASGLPKFTALADLEPLLQGPLVPLNSLPAISHPDILQELTETAERLAPLHVYAIQTTNPQLDIPAHYLIVPGLEFRERDPAQSLGLFTGRKVSELEDGATALQLLDRLEHILPDAPWLPFFRGMIRLRQGEIEVASQLFEQAAATPQPVSSQAMAAFYAGYAYGLDNQWQVAEPWLARAAELEPDMRDYIGHLGVCLFQQGQFARARECFDKALKLDKGSAIDLANRGVCEMELGLTEQAKEDLETALALHPGLDFARRRLAQLTGVA